MDISIVIVSYNGKEFLTECLKSIPASAGDLRYEVWVVDNGSSDGSAELVSQQFPAIKLLRNTENLGFSRANNLALREARGDFLLLLNQDMRLLPGSLVKMVEYLRQNPQAGAAGGHLLDEANQTLPSVRKFPKFLDAAVIVLKLGHIFPSLLNRYLMTDFNYAKAAAVDSIRGSFFMINRRALEQVGFLDERFFFWFEEVDYCRRLKGAGWQVRYLPIDAAVDLVGQSVKKMPFLKRQSMFLTSMFKYFWKWGIWSFRTK